MNNMGNNFLIGTIDEGITKNTKPWATPADSWEILTNMYQWRGRVVRKPPYSMLGQLSFLLQSQDLGASAQNYSINLLAFFTLSGVTIIPSGFLITVNGGANYTLGIDPDNPGSIILISGTNVPSFLNGSIDFLTGDLTLNFSGAPGGNVVITFFYVYGLPVMGLRTRELFELNEQDTIAFDTVYAYRFSVTNDQFVPLPSVLPTTWSGTDSQFFFTTNYAGAFWATNSKPGLHGAAISNITQAVNGLVTTLNPHGFTTGQTVVFINVGGMVEINGLSSVITVINPTTFSLDNIDTSGFSAYTANGFALNSFINVSGQDGIRYYGALTNGTGWANYNPPIDTNNALVGALLIFPYRGYLVFLNTTEGNEQSGQIYNYGNRARWTQIGTPYYSEPVPSTPNPQGIDVKAARDDLFGRGGANDAPTQEVIIGAAFVRDILVVFFERSTWRLRFVNNAQNPFVWERINVELGASATFSTIPFDKGAMAIGERGIVIADANDVARIDDKIPDTIFEIRIENEGMQRVNGIRTFRTKLNYWTIPSDQNPDGIFPDYILVYNYETKTWATFDDCFTCFGYFYSFDDMTWADLTEAWSTYDWLSWGGSEIDGNYENIIAGNQQGFVLALEGNKKNKISNPNFQNGPSLMISSITNGTPSTFNSINNNLPNLSWVILSDITGVTNADGTTLNGKSFRVINTSGSAAPDDFTLQEFTPYDAGLASGLAFIFTLSSPYIPIFPGSVNITVGSLVYVDSGLDGILYVNNLAGGTINYTTGTIVLNFPLVIPPTSVIIRVVSQNPAQGFVNIETIGTYAGGGYISKVSNIDIQSKIFNFLEKDKRARLSKIDFYLAKTSNGEFTADIYADSSNQVVNSPLNDNLRSNIVKTTLNPYQYGNGDQTIYRLYADAIGQTLQFNFYLSDQQMAVPTIASSNVEILALNVTLRPGGRLV